MHRLPGRLLCLCAIALFVRGQGLVTTATKDDWEEINFEFNSAILSDGYPSMLRLAALLREHGGYRVKLTGHTDSTGPEKLNEDLALRRANAVKQFLEKYGAQPGQITAVSAGEREPKVQNTTAEGRFINRRVEMAVTDEKGNPVSGGGVGDAIRGIENQQKANQALAEQAQRLQKSMDDCCSEILKRLDAVQDIANALRQLRNENSSLRDDLEKVRKAQEELKDMVGAQPKPATPQELVTVATKAAAGAVEKSRASGFSLLGINAGADDQGRVTFSGRGRYFAPFSTNFALQAQAEYLYFRDRKEGQFDIGLVNRIGNIQAGLFSSFKNVQLREFGAGGTLGQAALTFDYLFARGRIGIFGTKGYLDNPVLRRYAITRTLHEETYLKIVDQVGAATSIALGKRSYLEGNLGYLKSRAGEDRPGGTLRFVFPVNEHWALTLEGGMNETYLSRDYNGRVVGGVMWGQFLNPREFVALKHPVPVDVPRVRFETLTRRVRTGNDAPIADAGPDQIGIPAGTVTLDGSASYDPEGDPIRFQWLQTAGPAISLSGANTSRATFTASEGQSYTFRLTVTDDKGASAVARVLVTTARVLQARISKFAAVPQQIRAGQSSTLSWIVENADEVTIDGIGKVDPRQGTASVSPEQTATYRLTARNRANEVSETVTVLVERPEPRILYFSASPMTIEAGRQSVLSWQTENAESVEISGIGPVAQNGNASVSPSATATYTLTARGRFGQSTAQVVVAVNPPQRPVIRVFRATPVEIGSGESSTLLWQVENATEVSISALGPVSATGNKEVTPAETTTFVLTASNAAGETSAEAKVTVIPAVRITSFKATPETSPRPGEAVALSWSTENATEASIDGIGQVAVNGTVRVNPVADSTYTLRVFGRRSQQTAQVTVRVTPDDGQLPVADAGPNQVTTSRDVRLDGSKSFHPGGLVIGYSWRALGRQPESILGADTATPTVRFSTLAYGEYTFELTVTDSRGRFSRATTKVFFGAY